MIDLAIPNFLMAVLNLSLFILIPRKRMGWAVVFPVLGFLIGMGMGIFILMLK